MTCFASVYGNIDHSLALGFNPASTSSIQTLHQSTSNFYGLRIAAMLRLAALASIVHGACRLGGQAAVAVASLMFARAWLPVAPIVLLLQ